MNKFLIAGFMLALTAFAVPTTAADQSRLTLEQAIQAALQNAPDIESAEASFRAASGQRRQAEAFPNPSIGFEVENVMGSGAYNGIENAELTLGVNQQLQIGGKRAARIEAAEAGKTLAGFSRQSARLDRIRNVKAAFADAVAAQEQSEIMQQQEKLARDVYTTVDKRVRAAAEPLVQRNKAKIALANAELIARRAEAQKDAALKILVAQWSSDGTPGMVAVGSFYKSKPFSMDVSVDQLLKKTPDYERENASVYQAQSMLALEKANAVPDPTISLGLRDLRATNDKALMLGLSFPLPVFNQNRGNIESARQQAVKAGAERRKLLLTRRASLAGHLQQLQNAHLTATRIKRDILPEAQEAFRQAQRGYNAGKFAYLEVLDAQRTLTDTRIVYIQALRDYHVNKAEVERLMAQDETLSSGARQ